MTTIAGINRIFNMKASTKLLTITAILATMMTSCTSLLDNHSTKTYNGVARNVTLGAASGAVTQINGNSKDMRDAATIGALLGLLGSLY